MLITLTNNELAEELKGTTHRVCDQFARLTCNDLHFDGILCLEALVSMACERLLELESKSILEKK